MVTAADVHFAGVASADAMSLVGAIIKRTLRSFLVDDRRGRPQPMTEELPDGPGVAVLVVPMPGSVRPPTDSTAAMMAWLFAHGAPRTADVLSRLQRDGWTIEQPTPDAATQTDLWATARFADVEQARAAARPYQGRVSELLRWAPAGRPGDVRSLPFAEQRRR